MTVHRVDSTSSFEGPATFGPSQVYVIESLVASNFLRANPDGSYGHARDEQFGRRRKGHVLGRSNGKFGDTFDVSHQIARVVITLVAARGILAGLAMIVRAPFVFPSLGPTAFLFFFVPRSPAATPRHAIYGHAIGLLLATARYGSLACNTSRRPCSPRWTLRRVIAAALSLALTGALMIAFKAVHPTAGATTLIVSLGIVTTPWHLLVIECAVAVLTLQAIVINRHAGLDYPRWAWRERSDV